ncbi:hypothetical protein [Prauserella cavernicola]|uniref:DUF3137 domain-containing protein n=1 Tax=Prauserella cavernicola TaxID=2800127 RepID=A0A934QQ31_9PSEU|nr:hypothetical protein [Prauserella cavernicola]MBK1784051.1 hypothetical protein [Prauserella cavernicola]
MSEYIGPAIGVVLVVALIVFGLHHLFVVMPRRHRNKVDRVVGIAGLAQRLNGTVHTTRTGTRPSFGVLPGPRDILSPKPLTGPLDQFDQAVEFSYRGHQALGVDYTFNHRTPGHNRRYIRVQHNIAQVRIPPTPHLRIAGRTPAGLTYRGDALRVFPLGVPRFDDAFEVAAADEGFARTVLTGPMVDLLLYGARYRDKFLEFESGVLRSEFFGPLEEKVLLSNLDLLIDVVERLPQQAFRGS